MSPITENLLSGIRVRGILGFFIQQLHDIEIIAKLEHGLRLQ